MYVAGTSLAAALRGLADAVKDASHDHAEALVGFFATPLAVDNHTPARVAENDWLVENMPFGEQLVLEDELPQT